MRRLLFALAVGVASRASLAATPPRAPEVVVSSSRIHVGDIVLGLAAETASIDLGPSPAAAGARIIDKDEIVHLLHEHNVEEPPGIPAAVRVVRKMHRLDVVDIEHIVREALANKLPRGVTLTAIHAAHPVDVPEGWTSVIADLPRPPRRTGSVSSSASVSFYENSQALWMLNVPVDLTLSQEATIADLTRGSRVTLVIKRGLVEVSSSGTAGTDADVGGIVPVVIHPSGRIISARLEDKEHAVAIDTQ
jgi:flagella basal body P-ring formation protein FlgA